MFSRATRWFTTTWERAGLSPLPSWPGEHRHVHHRAGLLDGHLASGLRLQDPSGRPRGAPSAAPRSGCRSGGRPQLQARLGRFFTPLEGQCKANHVKDIGLRMAILDKLNQYKPNAIILPKHPISLYGIQKVMPRRFRRTPLPRAVGDI